MSERRSQGRPCRGASEVGRAKIVQGLRNLLRSGESLDLSRKKLALYTGVTPALITYYFPKKELLLEEAVQPIIEDYSKRLQSIIASDGDAPFKLRYLITMLVQLYRTDGQILEIYNALVRKRGAGTVNEVEVMTGTLTRFLNEWRGVEAGQSFDAAVLQGAVWGMCEFAIRAEAKKSIPESASDTQSESFFVDSLYDLITSGFNGRTQSASARSGICATANIAPISGNTSHAERSADMHVL